MSYTKFILIFYFLAFNYGKVLEVKFDKLSIALEKPLKKVLIINILSYSSLHIHFYNWELSLLLLLFLGK